MKGAVLDPPVAPSPVDPRLRARRIAVRRHEGRRRLRRLLVVLGVTLVLLASWGVTRSPLLDVDHITVAGAARTDAAAVLAVVGIARGDALADVDLGAAERGVAALPWVAQVSVTRSWGGTIAVEVVEREAVAVLSGPGAERWLVDGSGVVLAPAGAAEPSLPVVEGLTPVEPGQVLQPVPVSVLELVAVLPAGVRGLVEAIEVDAAGETWARLAPRAGEVDADGANRADGGRVRFGDLRAVDDQVLAAATVLSQVDLADAVVVDVRVPSNPVVTRTPPNPEVAG